MREPSKGGMGNRLNTQRDVLAMINEEQKLSHTPPGMLIFAEYGKKMRNR